MVHIFHCSRGGSLAALVGGCIVWNLEPLASGGQSSHKLIPHIICQFLYAREKTLNEDLFYKGSSANLPRLHMCENKVPFWDFKEFAVTIQRLGKRNSKNITPLNFPFFIFNSYVFDTEVVFLFFFAIIIINHNSTYTNATTEKYKTQVESVIQVITVY